MVAKGIGPDEQDLQDKIFWQRFGVIHPRPAIEFEPLRSTFQQQFHLDAGGCKICIHQECHLIPLPDQTGFDGQIRYKSKVQKRRRCDIFVVAPAKRFLSSVRSGICMPMARNYFMWRSLRRPLAKPITSKSPHIPEFILNQTASPIWISGTDTNKRHIFASTFCSS